MMKSLYAGRRAACHLHHRLPLRALPAALALLGMLQGAGAATVGTWTGAVASGNWSDAANWVEGVPLSGADVELIVGNAARASSFNDIAGGFVLHGLTLGASAVAPVLSGQALRFQGDGAFVRMQSTADGHGQIQNALQLDTTLGVTGGSGFANQLFFRGPITGSGGFNALGGITVLGGSNSFSGLTTVASGATLGVGSQALSGTSGVVVAADGQLQLVGSGGTTAVSVSAPLQLGGLLASSVKKVTNFLGQAVSGAFVTGPITLTADARMQALGATGTGLNATEFVVNGALDRAGHSLKLQTGGVNNLLRHNGPISGNGSLLLQPNGGAIVLGAVSGNGAIQVSGAGGSVTLGGISGDGAINVNLDGLGSVTAGGIVSGARPVRVSAGTLDFGNLAHSFVGQLQMTGAGEVRASDETRLGAAANTLLFDQGGVLDVAFGDLSRSIETRGGMGTVLVGGNATPTVSSVISGSGGIAFGNFSSTRAGVTLTASNSFAGGLVIGSGVLLTFATDANLGASGGAIVLGGALSLPNGYALARPLEVTSNTASVSTASIGRVQVSSNVTGSGALNLGGNNSGVGTVFALTGSNTHSGGVRVANAELEIDSDARLGAATGVLDLGRANGIGSLPGLLRATGNPSIAATRSTSFRNMTVDSNGFDVVFNQAINGLGMTKTGLGRWTLNTANSNSSNDNRVNVQQGTLTLGVNEALGVRSTVAVAGGAVLDLAGRTLAVTDINGADGSVIDLGSGGRLNPLYGNLNGMLQGQGNLVLGRAGYSPGSVTLNAANSFVGAVEVLHGSRLTVGHTQALGAAGNLLRLDGGTLSTSSALSGPLVVDAAMNLQIGPGGAGFHAEGQSIVIDRLLSGNTALTIQGGSRPGESDGKFDVRFANRNNSFVGDLVLGSPRGFGTAVLGITADGALGAASNRLTLGHSEFDGESTRSAQGGLRAWDSLTLAASRVIQLNGESGSQAGFIDTNGHTVVLQGSIGEVASGLGLLKTGAGTLVVNGVQAYTGRTEVVEGTLGGQGEVEQLAIQHADLAPGQSAGLFSIRQSLSFSDASTLSMELGGLARGSGYDALNVGGSLDLGSDTALRLSFINGFGTQALAGQTFELAFAAGGLFGQFSNVADGGRLMTTDGLGSYVVHYGEQSLSLSNYALAAAVPEPETWALLLAGLGLVGVAAQRRKAISA